MTVPAKYYLTEKYVRGNTIMEGEITYAENKCKTHQLIRHAKIFYSIVSIGISQIFVPNLPKWSRPSASKLRYSEYLKKYELCYFDTFFRQSAFQYTLAHGAVPQKCIYISKITGHHFPE